MPDAEVLLAEIQAQAETERERVLASGREQAEAYRAQAEQEIRRLEADAARRLERRLTAAEDRLRGEARLAAGVKLLAVRREWIDRAFQAARRRLAELCAGPGYEALVRQLVREAAAAVGGDGELTVAEADGELALRLVSELGLSLKVRAAGSEPGTAVVVSQDGLRRADNSLSTRLREAERSQEQEVARLLFGEPPG